MPGFKTVRGVRHRADEMFDLVADVESYPEFVPLCRRLVVQSRTAEGEKEVIIATMTVAYKRVTESFTSRVTLDRSALTIRTEYLDGPFHHLDSLWSFRPEAEGTCTVSFTLDYALRSWTLTALLGAVLDASFRRFTSAFEKRADVVYGRKAETRV